MMLFGVSNVSVTTANMNDSVLRSAQKNRNVKFRLLHGRLFGAKKLKNSAQALWTYTENNSRLYSEQCIKKGQTRIFQNKYKNLLPKIQMG